MKRLTITADKIQLLITYIDIISTYKQVAEMSTGYILAIFKPP